MALHNPATGVLDDAELKAALYGGLVNEDVMQRIADISPVETPFRDSIGQGERATNSRKGWTEKALAAPDKTNALIDGQNMLGVASNAAAYGQRVSNLCQIFGKLIQLSTRGQTVDSIGSIGRIVTQLADRQNENYRDIEAVMLSEQASVADNGTNVAGKLGAYFAWVVTNASAGATGANGGFNTTTGLVDAPTPGTTRPLSETLVRQISDSTYLSGGNPTMMMTIVALATAFSNYLFTSSARVATLQSDTGQKKAPLVAQGAVNVFVSNHGVTLNIVGNRIMQPEVATPGSERCNVAIYDPELASESILRGMRTEPLAKSGLSDNWQVTCDETLIVNPENGHGAIRDIDYTAAVIA